MIKITRLVFLFLLPVSVAAQSVDMERLVNLRYRNQQLGFILSDISREYSIPFSYSSNFIPVDKLITISERNIPLQEGLDKLFAPTQIVYALIGNSIALKIDESKKVIPIIEKQPIGRKQNIETEVVPFLKRLSYPVLVWKRPIPFQELENLKLSNSIPELEVPDGIESEDFLEKEMAQVTLIPPISTNAERAEQITNTFSFNILWGRNGGLDGIEVGGFVNSIVKDMRGFQWAGIGNKVDGDVQGGQLATIFNYNQGFTKGVQISGLLNIASTANVIQIAGFANFIDEDIEGVQAALFGNFARKKAEGIQAAGLANITKGYARTQVSLGLNKANEIKDLQAGFVNIAEYSKGRQIGFINISNQAEKIPIGFLSIAKNGYRRMELSAGESLYANVGFKFGFRKFYNIFQFGTRFTDDTWSLGYGIGTAFPLKERQYFHLEYVASHVNEATVWTKDLNLLNQFKFHFDWQTKGKSSFFIGPSWNILASKITDVDTLEVIGSNLPSYAILDTTRKNTNWKMWFGVNGGIRF